MCLTGLALMLRVRWPVLLLDQRGFLVLQHEMLCQPAVAKANNQQGRLTAHLKSIQKTCIIMCGLKQEAAKAQPFSCAGCNSLLSVKSAVCSISLHFISLLLEV